MEGIHQERQGGQVLQERHRPTDTRLELQERERTAGIQDRQSAGNPVAYSKSVVYKFLTVKLHHISLIPQL